jgi:hypothetical protein
LASNRYDANDDRWFRQVADFRRSLARETDGVRFEQTQVAGTKGVLESIVVSLTSAGALTATVEFFKAWLGRDSSRSIRVSFGDGGALKELEMSGTELKDTVLEQLTAALTARMSLPPSQP